MRKYFKTILFIAVLALFGLTTACFVSSTIEKTEETTIVESNGFLSVKGNQMVNQNGDSFALHGVSLGWHNWWPRFYNKGTIRWLTNDWKTTVVRAAIGVGPENSYNDKPDEALHLLYKVIDAAIDDGIYVIVDWHSHDIYLDEAKQFFTTVATKYKDYPNIIYEIFNEPVFDSWTDVKAYSIELIKTIREIDSKNIILVGTPHWDQDIHIAADDPITGFDNIMYTMHFYAATHGQELRDRTSYALSKGIPIFVSECAATEATGTGSFDMEEWKVWLNFMDQNKLSYVMWSVSDKDELCSMVENPSKPLSNWVDVDLKFWGKEVRNLLRQKWHQSKGL